MEVARALAAVVAGLPGGGEVRTGQQDMAAAVARAIAGKRHLIVQAGTGTGKTLAYVVPAILAGRRVVIATATKALQDQLCGKDLPFIADHIGRPFTYALLKGRSNYLCLQRAREALAPDTQMALDGVAEPAPHREVVRLVEWATTTATGDRADLPFEPSARAWSAVSVTARECPGPARCPVGEACFCERARDAAHDADVVVVNTHLYGMHLATDGAILPEHDVVVIDEAHQLEDIVSATAGLELAPGRFVGLARAVRAVLADDGLVAEVDAAGDILGDALVPHLGERLRGQLPEEVETAVTVGRSRVERAMTALRAVPDDGPVDVGARKIRAMKLASELMFELAIATSVPDTHVAWVDGDGNTPLLRMAPVEVAEYLAGLWPAATVILTSATIPPGLPDRLGMPTGAVDVLDVGSPFDYESNAILYCAADLPDPRAPGYEPAMHDELESLVRAAGGRTLALFTSWRAMTAAVEALRPRLGNTLPILAQGELPKPALVAAFAADEATSLFATMGFWQGIDVVGRSLSLVTLDRLPFPRPDEPLFQARRERARTGSFEAIDLPRAATLLAQGAGRLIRSATDRGVVAVLDPRLAKARYRWAIVRALPPMRRTRDRAEAEAFLREITSG